MASKVSIIFGAASINKWSAEEGNEFFEILKKYGVKDLDTAHIYYNSEQLLSERKAQEEFTIHTKAPGFSPGALSSESVTKAGEQSYHLLGKAETYFLHSPDPSTPIAETLSAINGLYTHGTFKHFGLSNFTPEQVQEVYDVAKKEGYVLPTVYQGNYNAVARRQESTLFPLLRKLGIRFYAYSPIGGGFLSKDISAFTSSTSGTGRFDPSTSRFAGIYNKLYNKPKLIAGLQEWNQIAQAEGITPAALAYRWIVYHSQLKPEFGDAVIVGASSPAQLQATLQSIEDGPLSAAAVEGTEKVWEMVKDEAPIDNFNN